MLANQAARRRPALTDVNQTLSRALSLWSFEPPSSSSSSSKVAAKGDDSTNAPTNKPAWLLSRAAMPPPEANVPPSWSASSRGQRHSEGLIRRNEAARQRPSSLAIALMKGINALSLGMLAPEAKWLAATVGPSSAAFLRHRDGDGTIAGLRDDSSAKDVLSALTGGILGGVDTSIPSLHVAAQAGDVTIRLSDGGARLRITCSYPLAILQCGLAVVVADAAAVPTALRRYRYKDSNSSSSSSDDAAFSKAAARESAAAEDDASSVPSSESAAALKKATLIPDHSPHSRSSGTTTRASGPDGGLLDVSLPWPLRQAVGASSSSAATSTSSNDSVGLQVIRVSGGVAVHLIESSSSSSSSGRPSGTAVLAALEEGTTPPPSVAAAASDPMAPSPPSSLLSRSALLVQCLGCAAVTLPSGLSLGCLGIVTDGRGEISGERLRVNSLAAASGAYSRVAVSGTHAGDVSVAARDASTVAGGHILRRGSLQLFGQATVDVTARQGADVTANTEATSSSSSSPA